MNVNKFYKTAMTAQPEYINHSDREGDPIGIDESKGVLQSSLNEWQTNLNPTKWTLGVVVWTENRYVQIINNNQSNQDNKNQDNKNLIQYDFPFVSGVSQLWTTEQGYIQEKLWDNAVKARIYCIRHGMSVEEKNKIKLQTAETELCEDAKKQYKENAEKLKRLWVKGENSYLLYCEETDDGKIVVRIAESAELIAQGIWIPPERILRTMIWLDTTDKDDDVANRRISITKSISIDFAAQLLAKLWNNTVWDINIICIIHKSNIEGIQEGIFQNKEDIESHLPKMDEIKTGEITCIDIDRVWQPLNYKRRFDVLRIDEWNYESILNILKWEEELQSIIHHYKTWKIQILEVQNYVNAYFQWNPEYFSRFLIDKNSSSEMKVFCLASLIKQQDYKSIENYYLSGECTSLSIEEKKIFLKNIKKPEVMKILRRLFVCRGKLWNEEEVEIFKWQAELYALLKQWRLAYTTATWLQYNSLDPLIKNGSENAVLGRKLYYEEEDKDTNPDTKKEQGKKIIVQRNFDPDMFHKDWKYSKFIIRAHVGEGKSIYLSELAKQFSLEQDKEVKFVIAKSLNEEDIKEVFSNNQTIVCIDALDEANEEIRKRIKEEFRNFEGRCIVSTRHSELLPPDDKSCVLNFNPIDSTKYIDSRFGEDTTNATKVKEWIGKHGLSSEVKGNPLLLNLIVILAKATKDDKKWMGQYKILEYYKIRTKSDLYESIVRFVLAKHNKYMKNQNCTNNDLSRWMEQLGNYAYRKFSPTDSNQVTSNDTDDFDTHLSILFKSETDGSYEFIHKSFYEFFLARHLANKKNGVEEIYYLRDNSNESWNAWREFRPITMFYGEILINQERWDELECFLWENGILKNDDIFGENFFIGLEILSRTQNDRLILSVRELFVAIVNWYVSKVDRVMKLKWATEVMKRCNFTDSTGVIEYIVWAIKWYLLYEKKTSENYIPLARIDDKESIDICCNECINIIKNMWGRNIRGIIERRKAEDLILQLVEIWSEYSYRQLIKIWFLLIEVNESKMSMIIFKKILKTDYSKIAEHICLTLMEHGEFESSIELIIEIMNRWNLWDYILVIEYLEILQNIIQEKGIYSEIWRALYSTVCISLSWFYDEKEEFLKNPWKEILSSKIYTIIETVGDLELNTWKWKIIRIKDEWDRIWELKNSLEFRLQFQLENTEVFNKWNWEIACENIEIQDNNSVGKCLFYLYLELANRNKIWRLYEITWLLSIDLWWDEWEKFLHKQLSSLPLEKILIWFLYIYTKNTE
jgi:hypothetical protein